MSLRKKTLAAGKCSFYCRGAIYAPRMRPSRFAHRGSNPSVRITGCMDKHLINQRIRSEILAFSIYNRPELAPLNPTPLITLPNRNHFMLRLR